jgi:hypothetical protein
MKRKIISVIALALCAVAGVTFTNKFIVPRIKANQVKKVTLGEEPKGDVTYIGPSRPLPPAGKETQSFNVVSIKLDQDRKLHVAALYEVRSANDNVKYFFHLRVYKIQDMTQAVIDVKYPEKATIAHAHTHHKMNFEETIDVSNLVPGNYAALVNIYKVPEGSSLEQLEKDEKNGIIRQNKPVGGYFNIP